MFKMRSRYFVIVGVMLVMLSVSLMTNAQLDSAMIVSNADGITLPEGLTAGYTTIIFHNDTDVLFAPVLARLINGASFDDFMGAMQQGPQAALGLVSVLGSPEVNAGEIQQASYELVAGDYIFANVPAGAPPTILPFSVAETSGDVTTEAPEADVVLNMVNFAFAIPGDIPAGEQVWRISNLANQPHHIYVYRVEDDAELTSVLDGFITAYRAIQPGQPPEFPYETEYVWTVMSPEQTAYATINLEAGRYAIACFIGDSASENAVSHLEHGMLRLIDVVDAGM